MLPPNLALRSLTFEKKMTPTLHKHKGETTNTHLFQGLPPFKDALVLHCYTKQNSETQIELYSKPYLIIFNIDVYI